jgi:uncharacterized cupin superfamily protein
MMRATMHLIRTNDAPWTDALQKGAYFNRRKPLGTGALTSGLWELPPGKKSFPLHGHLVTEEALYVVSGTGQVRTTEGVTAIGPGDYVTFPPGGPAHQLINDGTAPLVYLAMSVSKGVDVVEYPESGKVSASVGAFPHGKRRMFQEKDQVDYFAGEPDADAT